ncbi:Uncharacterized protein HZ326_12140 [Fusarium oxysporum f. sp. albedinis]|jgi:hypothetical protein|nr:Uncharacterized protein HZ326_12140 [Fusarium oxysporum f. sp. albedinis]
MSKTEARSLIITAWPTHRKCEGMEAECVGLRLMQPYKGDLGNRDASASRCRKHVLRWLINSAKSNNSSIMSQLEKMDHEGLDM